MIKLSNNETKKKVAKVRSEQKVDWDDVDWSQFNEEEIIDGRYQEKVTGTYTLKKIRVYDDDSEEVFHTQSMPCTLDEFPKDIDNREKAISNIDGQIRTNKKKLDEIKKATGKDKKPVLNAGQQRLRKDLAMIQHHDNWNKFEAQIVEAEQQIDMNKEAILRHEETIASAPVPPSNK